MLSYLICVLMQLYICTVKWFWQQYRSRLGVGVLWGMLCWLVGTMHLTRVVSCRTGLHLPVLWWQDLIRCLVKLLQQINGSIFWKTVTGSSTAFRTRATFTLCLQQRLLCYLECVSSLFISNTRKSFLCVSWERKPQKFPLLAMYSAQNMLSGNACSCLRECWKLYSL